MMGDPDSCGIWAPCLTHADGLFHLIYTDVKRYGRMAPPGLSVSLQPAIRMAYVHGGVRFFTNGVDSSAPGRVDRARRTA